MVVIWDGKWNATVVCDKVDSRNLGDGVFIVYLIHAAFCIGTMLI